MATGRFLMNEMDVVDEPFTVAIVPRADNGKDERE
jgi:hypothetical protein